MAGRRLSSAVVALTGWLLTGCATAGPPAPIREWIEPPSVTAATLRWQFGGGDASLVAPAAGWATRSLDERDAPAAGAICRGRSGASVLWLAEATPREFDLRGWVRTDAGAEESVGFALQGVPPERYLLARISTRNNNIRLQRRDGTRWQLLATRDQSVPVGRWHELAVRGRASDVVVGLDGEPILQVGDLPATSGAIGLWAESDTAVCFADVWLIPRGPASG